MDGLLVTKLLSALLLPPGCLILLGFAGLLFWHKVAGRVATLLAITLFWLLATAPVRDLLLYPLESQNPPLTLPFHLAKGDAIVLLGAGVEEQAQEYGGQAALYGTGWRRTSYAAWLAKQSGLPVYASGGMVLRNGESEAAVMRRVLLEFGLPAKQIVVEEHSKTTWQNASNLKPLLAADGIRRIWLVTSAVHQPRARRCFARLGIELQPAPCDWLAQSGRSDPLLWLPDGGVFRDSCAGLHEYLGLFWYWLRYD